MEENKNIRLEFEPSLIFNGERCVTCGDETKFWFSIPSSATCVRDVLDGISEAFACSGHLYLYVKDHYVPPHMNLLVLKDVNIKVRGPKYGPRNAGHDDGSLGLGCTGCEGQESDSSWFSGGDEMDDKTGSDGSDSGVSSSEYSNDEDSDNSENSEDDTGPQNDEKENDPNVSTHKDAGGVQGEAGVSANKKRPLEFEESDPKGNYSKLPKLTCNVQPQHQAVTPPPSSANLVIYSINEEEDPTEEVLCTTPMSMSNEIRKKSIPTPIPIPVAMMKHTDLKLGLPRKIRSSSSIASSKISKDNNNKQMQKHTKENNNRNHSYSKPLAIGRFWRSYAPAIMKTLDKPFLAFASLLHDSPTACPPGSGKKFYWGRPVPYHPSLTDNVVKFQHNGRFTRNIVNNMLHLMASPSWKWIIRVSKWRGGSNSDAFTGDGILVDDLGAIMQCVYEKEIGCFKKERDDEFFILMEEKGTDME